MVRYSSEVLISGILGADSLKEQLRGEPIAVVAVRTGIAAGRSMKDPLLLLFGSKLRDKGWRKCDRDFNQQNK